MYKDPVVAAEYSKQYNRMRRAARKSRGRCPSCGSVPTSGYVCCKSCRRAASTRVSSLKRARTAKGHCTGCGASLTRTEIARGTCSNCAKRDADYQRHWRKEVLDHYGRVCACCGETNELFLSVDHINNDGNKHRKEIGQSAIYRWLVKHGFPEGFQVLCYNCNFGKRVNGGICPHKTHGTSR